MLLSKRYLYKQVINILRLSRFSLFYFLKDICTNKSSTSCDCQGFNISILLSKRYLYKQVINILRLSRFSLCYFLKDIYTNKSSISCDCQGFLCFLRFLKVKDLIQKFPIRCDCFYHQRRSKQILKSLMIIFTYVRYSLLYQ